MLRVSIRNLQKKLSIDRNRIRRAARMILRDNAIETAEISVAVVDDKTIAELHARYLNDPSPTDALSFPLEASPGRLVGEVVVGAETAAAVASRCGESPDDELLLYIVHGLLHLVGFDDITPAKRRTMRKEEKKYLEKMKLS
jgi:probable rRNA maturation factor